MVVLSGGSKTQDWERAWVVVLGDGSMQLDWERACVVLLFFRWIDLDCRLSD